MPREAVAAEAIFGMDGLPGELRRANALLGIGSVGIRMARVKPQSVTWMWQGRIPRGKISVLDGDPGLGKSTVTLDLAARVSRGLAMPDGAPGVLGGVVLANAEDDLGDTVRPRLDAAGGDCERILALPVTSWADLANLDTLRTAIEQVAAVLVVIDPLMAYLPAEANSWRDQDVRRVLAPLAALAAETRVAVVLVRHLRKAADGNPLYRGGGSIGIIGAARSGLLVARDPDDPERRVLAVTKSNLAREAASLRYQTVERGGAVGVEWLGESSHGAAALMSQPASAEERGELADACDWLRDRLPGAGAPTREVLRDAREAGISPRTLDRARARLGVRAANSGRGTPWVLRLPDSAKPSDSANIYQLGGVKENTVNTRVKPDSANSANISPARVVGGVKTAPESEL